MPLLSKRIYIGAWALVAVAAPGFGAVEVHPSIEQALERLYNFDFGKAHAVLDLHAAAEPDDPVGSCIRGAVYLFYELDRLRILETEFFRNDKRLAGKEKLEPDPEIRNRFMDSLAMTQRLAAARLASDPRDVSALFALTLKEGLMTDYVALVEKRGLRSLRYARVSNAHALRLLELEPEFHDARLAKGINEYLIGSLPFFIRWFIRIDGVQGSKEQAFENLELVAERGRYLGPFAKILLSIMSLREDEPERARELLSELTRDFPENPLLRYELDKVTQELAGAER